MSVCYADYEDDLAAVGGTAARLFAAEFEILQLRPAIRWLNRPKQSPGLITTIVDQGPIVLFGVYEPAHILVYNGSRFWIQWTGTITISDGRKQPDGSALFWGRGGLIRVHGQDASVIRGDRYQTFAAAAIRDGYVYAVDLQPDSARLIRFPLPPAWKR